jgi:hypothetical protein|tara:strand:- start:11540 stop:11962 length:423 start_codon:yes stop_codon:yes gene_type:complete
MLDQAGNDYKRNCWHSRPPGDAGTRTLHFASGLPFHPNRALMSTANDTTAPAAATDAVLKPSAPVPEGSREVQGIDFNQYASRSITVEELVGGYANMGFQATSVGEAVRIINDMVSVFSPTCIALARVGAAEKHRNISVR